MKKSLLTFSLCLSVGLLNAQIITTIAGSGVVGNSGNGGPATAAKLNYPNGIAVDNSGNVYFSDFDNQLIWKVNSSGTINVIAGNGAAGTGGDGGPATAAQLHGPCKVGIDLSGNVYWAEWNNNKIRKINSSGIISTYAGTGASGYTGDGGPALSAQLAKPESLSEVDALGNIYVGEQDNSVIRKINSSGTITTIIGTGSSGYTGDGGPATNATIQYARGIAFDNYGNFYIADFNANVIRKVNSSGTISTLAGTGASGYTGDGGAATAATMKGPSGIAIGYDNMGEPIIYFADEYNAVIRKIYAGTISTVAGNGTHGFGGDGDAATNAKLRMPVDVAVDGSGNLYIADAYNYRIRKVIINTSSVTDVPVAQPYIKVYPVPAQGHCTVQIPELGSVPVIQLIDMVGRVVYTKTGTTTASQNIQLDLQHIVPGNYLVKVIAAENILKARLTVR